MAITNPSERCFAHHHMTPAEYGFWQLSRDLSHKTGRLYFDGRSMAKRFAGTPRNGLSKNYFYTLLKALIKRGWFERVEPRKRDECGQWEASVFQVLSHPEWVVKFGCTLCNNAADVSSPDSETGSESPVLMDTEASPDSNGTSPDRGGSPVLIVGHNPMYKPDINLSDKNQSDPAPSKSEISKAGETDFFENGSRSTTSPDSGTGSKQEDGRNASCQSSAPPAPAQCAADQNPEVGDGLSPKPAAPPFPQKTLSPGMVAWLVGDADSPPLEPRGTPPWKTQDVQRG